MKSDLNESLLKSSVSEGGKQRFIAEDERRSSEYRTIPASQRLWNFFVFYKRSTLFFVVATIYMLGISAAIPAMHPVMEVEGEEVELTWQSYFAIECTFLALLFFLNDSPPDLVGLVISITLVLFKVVTIDDAIGGFSSSSVLAIGVLFVVAKGLENTGAISKLLVPVMGESKNLTVSLLRMTFPVAIMSAFMNNTPVVAILIPVLQQWAPRIGHSPKKFLIPLSYSSMLGGTLTLLGTSTNLVLQDLVQKSCLPDGTIDGTEGNVPCIELGMFTMAPVGICMVIVGLLFMAFTAGCLLPGGQSMGATRDDVDEKMLANHYPLAMVVSDESVLVGKDLLGAGLLSMKGLVVISIATKSISYGGGNMISGKELDDYQLAEGDSLHLAVTGDAISLIRSLEGLEDPASMQKDLEQLGAGRRHRRMFEVVISPFSPLNGMKLQSAKAKCWEMYNAVVYAGRVSAADLSATERKMSKIDGKGRTTSRMIEAFKDVAFQPLDGDGQQNPGVPVEMQARRSSSSSSANRRSSFGDFERESSLVKKFQPKFDSNKTLKAGDCLLLEAFETFERSRGSSVHFLSTRLIKGSVPPRRNTTADIVRTWLSGFLLLAMVACVAADLVDILTGSTTVAIVLVCIQCLSLEEAFSAIKGRVVLAIVMTYSLGTALKNWYVALLIAQYLQAVGVQTGPVGLLCFMFLATALLSCIVSNQAAVILLYPVVVNLANEYDKVSLLQFVIILMMGASTAFATPVGYQTNLMVYGEGNYKFVDFVKVGLPLTFVLAITASFATFFLIE